MKSIVNKLLILSVILLGYSSINAQLADVTYSVRVGNVFSSEGGVFGPCWESGNEEYTAYGGFFDNTNTNVDLSGCLQCNNNGNCNYGGGTFIGSRSNNAYQLYYYIDAWEDDNGSRCSYNSGDDCRNAGSPGFLYFREITGPTNDVYYAGGPQAGGSSHQIRLDWTWKYSGNANALNPGCSAAYASYSGGAIHSWSANLNAGRTYQFSTLGLSGEDTYIRIYSPDGFTLYASNDDASGTLQSNAVFTPSVSGTYYVEVSRFDRQYLTGGGSLMYQDASTPPVNGGLIGASSTVCSGGGASFSSISEASGGFDGSMNYQWQSSSNGTSWSNILGATGSTYAVSNLTSTTYFRRMAADCKNTAGYSNTVTVTVNADPSVTITTSSPNGAICVGGTTALSANISGGTGSYTLQWQYQDNSGNWLNTGSGTTSMNASPTQSRDYRILVSNNLGCDAVAVQTVTVVADPVFTISGTDVTCNGLNNGTATAVLTGGLPLNYGYNWSSNDGISTNNNPTGDGTTSVTGLFPAEWVINTTASPSWGCYATASIVITEPSVLTASSASGSIACNGGTTTVTVSGNGGTAPYSGTGTFTVGAGTYNYTVTDANGCTATTSITVTEPSALTASISSNAPNATVCSGGTAALSSSVSGGTGSYTLQWQYQDNSGNWLNTGSGATVLNASPSQTRDYRLIVTDANGCSVIVVQTVTVIADPVFTISGTNVTCNGFNDGTATAVLTGGLPLNYGYNWYSNDGISSNNNPAGDGTTSVTGLFPTEWVINTTVAGPSFGCYAGASITITEPTPLSSNAVISDAIDCYGENGEIIVFAAGGTPDYSGIGTFSVSAGDYSYTVTDANGCVSSVDISISQPELLVASSSISDDINCYGETGVISVSAIGGTLDYSGTGDFTVSAGDYSYTVTDANGCSSTTSITITEPSLLTINAGGDETVFYGYGPMSCASLTAVAEGGTPDYTYVWNSGVGADITVCPTENGEYTVSVSDANGCVATDELWICVVDVTCQAGNSGNIKVEMCQIPPGNPGNAHTICIDASAVPAHLAIGCVLGACGELESACSGVVEVVQASNAAKNAGMSKVLALTAYPNPVAGMTTISVTPADKGNYEIRMIDMTGRTVATIYNGFISDFENITFDMDMTGMSAGVYSVNVVGDNGIADNIKIVKQ
jgi:hypothetical protein